MSYVLKERWYLKELSEDGLLKDYKESQYGRDEQIYNSYGYESEQEALEDLKLKTVNCSKGKKHNWSSPSCIIIKEVTYVWED